jgi:hypothetical protein
MKDIPPLIYVYMACSVLMILSVVMWTLAGFFAWSKNGEKPHFFCYHDIEYGGGMGDAVTCTKCGLDTYDGFNSHLWIFRLLGRVRDI